MAFEGANDAVASEQSIFTKIQHYKNVPYVPLFWGLDACGGRKLIKSTHTQRQILQLAAHAH